MESACYLLLCRLVAMWSYGGMASVEGSRHATSHASPLSAISICAHVWRTFGERGGEARRLGGSLRRGGEQRRRAEEASSHAPEAARRRGASLPLSSSPPQHIQHTIPPYATHTTLRHHTSKQDCAADAKQSVRLSKALAYPHLLLLLCLESSYEYVLGAD